MTEDFVIKKGKRNIVDKVYDSLDDVFNDAKYREISDKDSKTYAMEMFNKVKRALSQHPEHHGTMSVPVSGGNEFIGFLNKILLGKEGREHEARYNDDDVLIKKGKNNVTFSLYFDGTLIKTMPNGNKEEINERDIMGDDKLGEKYKSEVFDVKEKIIKEAEEHNRKEAIEQGFKDEKIIQAALLQGKVKNTVEPDFSRLPTIEFDDITYEPKYSLKIKVDGADIKAIYGAKINKDPTKIGDEEIINMFFEQAGRRGDFAPTKLDTATDYIKKQAIRGATFRVSSLPLRATSKVVDNNKRSAKQGESALGKVLAQVLAAINKGTITR